MKEILGNHLTNFFVEMKIQNENYNKDLMRTYKGDRYEVYSVSDELFNVMCDMTEKRFEELAGEDAWWRSAEGSNQGIPDTEFIVYGFKMIGWHRKDKDEDEYKNFQYANLSDYLCYEIGASLPKNVCALAVDLAKYNNMTMGELFTKYGG